MKHKIILWGSVIIIIIAAVVGMFFLSNKPSNPADNIAGQPGQISMADWVRGDANAKVTLVEYSDFQCPACAAYYPLVKKLEEKFGSQMSFTYRHFPLSQIHKNAELAAMAAEAAGLQGKFWEMHDMLFENQTAWSNNYNAKKVFIGYAEKLVLNTDQFENDLDRKDLRDKIAANYKEGVSIGINGTPSFFVNGVKITNPKSYEEFEKIISEKLAQ